MPITRRKCSPNTDEIPPAPRRGSTPTAPIRRGRHVRPAPALAQVDIHVRGLGIDADTPRAPARRTARSIRRAPQTPIIRTGSGTRVAMPAGVRKMPPPIVMPITRPIELKRPSLLTSVAMVRGYYPPAAVESVHDSIGHPHRHRRVVRPRRVPVVAQTPARRARLQAVAADVAHARLRRVGVLEEGLRCIRRRCINKAGEAKTLEGEVEHMKFVCPASASHEDCSATPKRRSRSPATPSCIPADQNHDHPVVTAQKGAQWIQLQTAQLNEFPTHDRPPSSSRRWRRECSASAPCRMRSPRAASSMSTASPSRPARQRSCPPRPGPRRRARGADGDADRRLRIEGHTDNVGDKAANLKLSNARAAAVRRGSPARASTARAFRWLDSAIRNRSRTTPGGRARNRRVVLVKQ